MATDLDTGEVGNAAELLAKAQERRRKRWDDKVGFGLNRMKAAERDGVKITPTRFYKLVYGYGYGFEYSL